MYFAIFISLTGSSLNAQVCDLTPYTTKNITNSITVEGLPISVTQKTSFNFTITPNDEYIVSSHTDLTIDNFTGLFTQMAGKKIPGSNCYHRYRPFNYRTWVDGQSVKGEFEVTYEKWICETIPVPALRKGWIPTTYQKEVKTILYQKTVKIVNTITPQIQDKKIELKNISNTYADGGLSDGLGVFGGMLVPFDTIVNIAAMNSINIPNSIIDIPSEAPNYPDVAGFILDLKSTSFVPDGGTTLRINYEGNKNLREGSACRLKQKVMEK